MECLRTLDTVFTMKYNDIAKIFEFVNYLFQAFLYIFIIKMVITSRNELIYFFNLIERDKMLFKLFRSGTYIM